MKNRFLLIALALFFVAFGGMAQKRTANEAMAVAKSFLSKQGRSRISSQGDALSLTHTSKKRLRADSDQANFYVFNRGKDAGYIIVSADGRTKNILGYADEGSFDMNNMPENFRSWLQFYEDEIESLDNPSGLRAATPTTNQPMPMMATGTLAASVAPLVTTKWNQDSPYNYLCPTNTVTGCVATAMAQIMKYHNHPVTGTGSHTYNPSSISSDYISSNLTAKFGETTYDWANMLPSYSGNFTNAQRDAVATLMYHCGVSVDMGYMSGGDSGANSGKVPSALINYFKYDKGISLLNRDFYTFTDWTNIIRSELTDGRPIYYGGRGSAGGHAFVCDGYDASGLFHFNWGWSGRSDGYFELSALNPTSLGTGGGSGGFNYGQEIIIGIKPSTGSGNTAPAKLGSYNISTVTTSLASLSTSFTVNVSKVQNIGAATFVGIVGLALYNSSDALSGYIQKYNFSSFPSTNFAENLNYSISLSQFSSTLPNGIYKLYPAYSYSTDASNPIRMDGIEGGIKYLTITVGASGINIDKTAPTSPVLSLSDFAKVSSNIYQNKTGMFKASITNNGTGDYHSELRFKIGTQTIWEDPVVIPVGKTRNFEFSGNITLTPGTYNATILYDQNNDPSDATNKSFVQVGLPLSVEVKATPTGTPTLLLSSASFPNSSKVNRESPELKVVIKNTGSFYDGDIRASIYPATTISSSPLATLERIHIQLENGQEKEILFNAPIDLANDIYRAFILWQSGTNSFTQLGNPVSFTLTDPPSGPTALTLTKADAVYNGQEQQGFTFTKQGGGAVTLKASDYNVSYAGRDGTTYPATSTQPTNAGKYTATVTLINTTDYSLASNTVNFEITPKPLNGATVSIEGSPFTYNGSLQTPTVKVKISETNLMLDADYTWTFANNTGKNAGTATVKVSGKNNYSGDVTKDFEIGKKTITVSTAVAKDKMYNGTKESTVELTYASGSVISPDDAYLTVIAEFNGKDVGSNKTVTITSLDVEGVNKANYQAPAITSVNSIVTKANITVADYTYSLSSSASVIAGSKPSWHVWNLIGTGVTVAGTAEQVTGTLHWFEDAACTINADDYAFVLNTNKTLYWSFTGNSSNYSATPKTGPTAFTVTEGDQQSITFNVASSVTKTFGDVFTVTATNHSNGGGSISYSSSDTDVATVESNGTVTAKKVGTATIKATAAAVAGKYAKSEESFTLIVTAKSLTGATVDVKGAYTYDGTLHIPNAADVIVKLGNLSLTTATDYGFAVIEGGSNAGPARLLVTGKGNYTGSVTREFTISPLKLTGTVTFKDKIYDAKTNADVNTAVLNNIVGSDDVAWNVVGSFSDANAGDDKAITVTSNTISGSYAANYSAPDISVSIKANITKADYEYAVLTAQNVIIGSGKTAITVAPARGQGVVKDGSKENVAGTLVWYDGATPIAESYTFNGNAGDLITLNWKFTATDANYIGTEKSGSTTFTLQDGAEQSLTFTLSEMEKVYGSDKFTLVATNGTTGGGAIKYSTSNATVAEVNETSGEVTVKNAGIAIITATAARVPGAYAETEARYTLTVVPKSLAETGIRVFVGGTYVYNGLSQTPNAADVVVKDGSTTLANPSDYTFVLASGGTDAGDATVTVSGVGNYSGTATGSFTVARKTIDINPLASVVAEKFYDGTKTATVQSVAFTGTVGSQTLLSGQDYNVSNAEFNSANVADATTVTATVTLVEAGAVAKNYTLSATGFSQSASITPATIAGGANQIFEVKAGLVHNYTFDLKNLLPGVTGLTSVAYSIAGTVDPDNVLSTTPSINGEELTIDVASVAAGKEAVVSVDITSSNYASFTATVTVRTTDKTPVTVTNITMTGGVYDNVAYAYTGTAIVKNNTDNFPVTGLTLDVLYESADGGTYSSSAAPVNAGDYKLTLSVPTSDASYSGSAVFNFSITKRPIKVKADDKTAYVNDPLPGFTYTVVNLATGENEGNALSGTPTASSVADMTVAGNYSIDVDLTGVTTKSNYIFDSPATISGTLTVNAGSPVVHVTGVSVIPSSISLITGEAYQLTANVLPANASNRSVVWSSSNGCVSVSANGIVTANYSGSAYVTATTVDGGYTSSSIVTVSESTPPQSSDANLYSLSISVGTLSPAFSPDITEYTVNVPYDTTSISIGGVASSNYAQVSGGGEKTLEVGPNHFSITVTAEDGSTKVYHITVIRANGTIIDGVEAEAEGIRVWFDDMHTLLYIQSDNLIRDIRLYDLSGRQHVAAKPSISGTVHINVTNLSSGGYVIRVETDREVMTSKIMKK